jgi:hypothetical protein
MTIVDKAGMPFDGGSTYRLNVSPNPPVRLYWSATAYDRATHALIRDQKSSSRSSLSPGLQKNRRLGGHLFRTGGAGGKGAELGADERQREIRSVVPPLWS